MHYGFLPSLLLRSMTHEFDSLGKVPRLKAPALYVHGNVDDIVPMSMGRRLFAASSEPKEWYEIEGAGHADTHRHDPGRHGEFAGCRQPRPARNVAGSLRNLRPRPTRGHDRLPLVRPGHDRGDNHHLYPRPLRPRSKAPQRAGGVRDARLLATGGPLAAARRPPKDRSPETSLRASQ